MAQHDCLNGIKQQIDALAARNNALEAKNMSLNDRVTRLEAENTSFNDRVTRLEAEVAVIRQFFQNREKVCDACSGRYQRNMSLIRIHCTHLA